MSSGIIIFSMMCLFQPRLTHAQMLQRLPGVSAFQANAILLEPSWVKKREELNTSYLLTLDPDRLLHNFRVNAGLPSAAKPLGGWEGPGVGLKGQNGGQNFTLRPLYEVRDQSYGVYAMLRNY